MIIWLNGAFGSGKTTCAYELQRRRPGSYVYDPENVGYWLRSNIPEPLRRSDFQDYERWRSYNLDMLRWFAREFDGDVIVPMTVVEPAYFAELVQPLIDEFGARHIILYASRETLRKRLNRRIERGETWAKAQIERCVTAFDTVIVGEKIVTDDMSEDEVVLRVAELAGLTLAPETRSALKRQLDRALTLVRHIRR